jgi:hypothetical protein
MHLLVAEVTAPTLGIGERTRISRDYAADNVQLAYASTVHGIQGETTDAALVGYDVDAAGLYVGLTRGRQENRAITVARSDAAARDALADTMLRGTTELTISDARRAVESELVRAARDLTSQPQGVTTTPATSRARSL